MRRKYLFASVSLSTLRIALAVNDALSDAEARRMKLKGVAGETHVIRAAA